MIHATRGPRLKSSKSARVIRKFWQSEATVEGAGVQLRANLPSTRKMIAPRYRELKASDIPIVRTKEGRRSASSAAACMGRMGRCERS